VFAFRSIIRRYDRPLRSGDGCPRGVLDIGKEGSSGWEYCIVIIRSTALVLALSICVSAGFAQNGKLNDRQIAHIAYTAGVIDVTLQSRL
jgi:hypothetical protein